MSIIEQAARRLEKLSRAGIAVPWDAAGVAEAEVLALAGQREMGEAPPPAPAASGSLGDVGPRASADAPEARAFAAQGQGVSPAGARRSELVEIDLVRLGLAGYLVPGNPRSALADEFQAVKRPLLKNVHSAEATSLRRSNLILVTSGLPAEGKTFCATNLALSIASEMDTSVLLVDADVVRPSLLMRLGVPNQHRGLLDLLSNQDLEVADVMLRTNVPKLSILPAGTPRENATELLASAAMDRLLNDLADRYADRIIVFDAPPILVTTEAKVLATRIGQVLVVVDEGRLTVAQVGKVFAALGGVPVVVSVLNRSRRRKSEAQYGYYEQGLK